MSWKKKALEMMVSTDKSWRQIAKELGKSKSTVSDYLRKFKNNPEYLQEVILPENKPKILLFDIETSLIQAYVWGLWKQNISINQVIEDWYVICWSAKWYGDQDVFNSSVHDYELPLSGRYKDNERYVVEALWKCLDEADIIVAYNGKSFDRKSSEESRGRSIFRRLRVRIFKRWATDLAVRSPQPEGEGGCGLVRPSGGRQHCSDA